MGDASMHDNPDGVNKTSAGDAERALQQQDPDALYDLGMAYYRRRHWRQAKACFEQLHALQPTRRGVEALLRELDIFLQLESVEADTPAEVRPAQVNSVEQAAGDAERAQREQVEAQQPEAETAPQAAPKRRWWLAPLILFISAVIVGAVYLFTSGPLASQESETGLRNQMQSYLVAQRYCQALEVATKLVALVPGDPEALNAIEKSKSKLYAEATDYAAINDTEHALSNLECIYLYDPTYEDVSAQMESLKLRGELAELYRQAHEDYMGTGAYGEAIKILLKIRALDATYRPGTISDDLYEAYLGEARQWLDLVSSDIQPVADAASDQPQYSVSEETLVKVREVSKAYDRALGERPNDAAALLAKAQAEALYDGLQRYINWTWAECVTKLTEVYSQDAAYLSGKLAALLCDASLRLADTYYQKQAYEEALAVYQSLAEIQTCDAQTVATLIYQAALPLTPTATPTDTPSPTVTPTATASPTYTLRPTSASTPTATPTPTVLAPTSAPQQPTSRPQPTHTPQPPTPTSPPPPTSTLKPRN